jgi:hypothetical protein
MRAKTTDAANSRQLFHELAGAADKRGYVTLSRRALSLASENQSAIHRELIRD